MILHSPKRKPEPLAARAAFIRRPWLRPLVAIECGCEWLVYFLSHWAFLELLEYLGSFSILIAVIFYFSESGDRLKQKHYQAWQVINTAQGKGGNGGRIEALEELDEDRVPLVGVDVSGAFLQGIRLPHAGLVRANLNAVDARNANFHDADFSYANLHSGNFRNSDFSGTNLQDADLGNGDYCAANFGDASLDGATLDAADFGGANLQNIKWQHIKSVKGAVFANVKNAPQGFVEWAVQNGAKIEGSDCQ